MFKRIISFLLAVVMVVSMLPVTAMAGETVAETTEAVTEPAETELTKGTTAPTETESAEAAPGEETVAVETVENASQDAAYSVVRSGTCGDNLNWTLDSEGTLAITGTGAMKKYYSDEYIPWYYNRGSITAIVLPEGLTNISQFAFYGCEKITEITLPSTLEGIEKSAFAECTALTGVVIPDKVRYLKESAFYGCESLESVVLGSGMQSIWEKAFMYCTNLREVDLGSGLETIRGSAFCYCENLEKLHIPQSVKYIYENAFSDCGIRELTIEGNPSWSGQVFNCPNLEVITIGSELSTLPSRSFRNCPGVLDFVVDKDNPYFTAQDGVLFQKDRTQLLRYPAGRVGGYEIPEGVTQINESAFEAAAGLSSIRIPDSVTKLQNNAFTGCTGLAHVAIPDSVTEIGGEAFMGCSGLEYAEIGRSVQRIQYRAFQNCTELTKVVIPESVTDLGADVYSGCTKLKDVTIGSGVTTIGKYAFNGCTALTSMVLPDNVTSVGESLFVDCKNLRTVTLSQNLTSIPRSVFCNSGLTHIAVPASVSDIEANAFNGCERLDEVVLSEGLVRIGEGAFGQCVKLTKVIIPDSVTTLGYGMFAGCTNLETVVLGERTGKIENYTFQNCSKLKQIVIPAGVTGIGTGAFMPAYGEASALQDIYYGGSEEQWKGIAVGTNNEALKNATVHFNYSPGEPEIRTELRFYERWDQTRQRVYFGEQSSAVTDETDPAFRADPEALLNKYVMVEVKDNWGIETLISMGPVQVMAGIVTAMDKTHVVIGGETYAIPEGNAQLDDCVGMYVLYYVFDGRIVRLERLNISEYLDNGAITINGPGSAFAYYVTGPRMVVFYQVNGTSGTVLADDKGIVRIPLGTFRVPMEHKVPVEITRIGDAIFEPAITLEATVKVMPTAFTQTWEASLDAGIGIALNAGGEVELLGNNFTATLGKIGGKANASNTLAISRSYSESGESLELTTKVQASAGAEVKSGITAKTIKSEFGVIEASADIQSGITGLYGIKFPEYVMENGAQQAAIATYLLGETLKVQPNTVMYWGFYEMLRGYVFEESGAVVIQGSGAGVNGTIGAAAGVVEVDDVTIFEAIGADAQASSSYSKKIYSNGEVEKNATYAMEENLSVYALGAGSKNASYQAGGLLTADFLGKDISVTAQKTDNGNVLDATFLSASAVGINTFLLEKNYTSQYGHYVFRDDPLTYLSYNTSCIDSFVNGDRKILSAENLGEIAQFLSDSYFHVPYSQRTKEQIICALPLTFGLGLGVEADLGITLSFMEATEYDTAMGYAVEDTIRLTSESENAAAVVAREKMSLPELMLGSMASLAKAAGEFFVSVGNSIVDGVETAWAWITGKPDSKYDRSVSITAAKDGGKRSAWAISYTVDTYNDIGARTELPGGVIANASAGANYEFSKAATVGRPFVVSVTDNVSGESVADFSDEPLKFTVRYAQEDLEAAGLSAQSAAVLDGDLAMYRYSDEGDYFEFIGGTSDLHAMTVTAQITKPGQYILAVDSCAPAIRVLDMSDFRNTPTITARIDDLSGLDLSKFVFRLDGDVKAGSGNVLQYFNSVTGLFTYAVTEALAEGEHTMSFTLADTTGNMEIYEYSFVVDLTAPTVSDVTVEGYTNADSTVEIRAVAGDENLTSVMALFSKRLSDGTWSAEVGTELGDMGDGMWGLDYEGDGSFVKIRICAVDIAGNQTFSDVFEVRPYVESVEISQEYIALRVGQTMHLTAEVQPAQLTSGLTWKAEDGGKVASVDENGTVTAKMPGTTYILAIATDGEKEITSRCRVDVAESLALDGVTLSTGSVSVEVYSTKYAKLDILMEIPQNYSVSYASESKAETLSAAISEAYFTDEALRSLFELRILDDRTVEIVPTETALSGKLAPSYTGTVTVVVEGTSHITEMLTLKVKSSLPKLKVSIPAFNSFYTENSQSIDVAGATVTGITADSRVETALPEWLRISNGTLYLTADAPRKSASGKVSLEILTEEWAVPLYVTAAVKCSYKAPGLKLSGSSIQLSGLTGSSEGVEMKLLPKNKKDTLESLKVLTVSAPDGYSVTGYENGTFTVKGEAGFEPGKIQLEVHFSNTSETLKLPLTVKTTQVKLKPDKSTVSLNAGTGDSIFVGITATPDDYVITAPVFRLVDGTGAEKLDSGELEIRSENRGVRINTTEKTPLSGNYTLYIRAGNSKEAALKIKIVEGKPSMSLKQSTNIDLSFPDQAAIITTGFKNYGGGRIEKFDYSVAESKSGENASAFFAVSEESGTFLLTCTNPASVREKGSYVLTLKITLADGSSIDNTLKLKVKRTAVKLKLSASKVSLNKALGDTAEVGVSCATEGYVFAKPFLTYDHTKLDVFWQEDKLKLSLLDGAAYGQTYPISVSAHEGAPAVKLNVAVLKENVAVKSTIKATGFLDVIRDSTAITVKPTYTNIQRVDVDKNAVLKIYSSADQYSKPFATVKAEDGVFTINDSIITDHTLKYRAQLETDLYTDKDPVESNMISLNVKMGSTKLTVQTSDTVLFAKDKYDRAKVWFEMTDKTLNDVAKVEIKDAKQAAQFKILDYENGEYAIAYKGDTVDPGLVDDSASKTVTITLNVFVEGNETEKANTTAKVKLTIVN